MHAKIQLGFIYIHKLFFGVKKKKTFQTREASHTNSRHRAMNQGAREPSKAQDNTCNITLQLNKAGEN